MMASLLLSLVSYQFNLSISTHILVFFAIILVFFGLALKTFKKYGGPGPPVHRARRVPSFQTAS